MTGDKQRTSAMRVVVFKDETVWGAVCLEHFVGAQGRTIEEVKQRLQTAYRAELEDSRTRGSVPFNGIEAAPERFQIMWDDPAVTRGTIFEKEDKHLELAA